MRLTAGPDDAGRRLDAFLAAAVGSRSRAQRLIEAGAVRVDGAPAAKRHRMAAGQQVEAPDSDPAPERAPAPTVPVVHEDEHVLVVDKPAGVVVHPAPGLGAGEATLVDALAGRIAGGPDPDRPGVVHRLDRDTSGLLVLARREDAHAALTRAMRERLVEREYLALVEGRPPARSGTIDAPLGRDRRRRTLRSTDTDEPREAVTRFALEEALAETTLLRVQLETGRTHQIRAHLRAIGHPVCGDAAYGTAGMLGLRRQFLHAHRLAFPHPAGGERVELRSALPGDLASALRRAQGLH